VVSAERRRGSGSRAARPSTHCSLAAYTFVRQFIIGMRDEPRRWRYGRRVTAAVAAVTLVASVFPFAVH